MLRIDEHLLKEVGLGDLPEGYANKVLAHTYRTLEMRVGFRIADDLTESQLDEFETFFEAKDDAGAFAWLEEEVPRYRLIVREELAKLREELRANSGRVLAAALAASRTVV